jgi:hypothetical protein
MRKSVIYAMEGYCFVMNDRADNAIFTPVWKCSSVDFRSLYGKACVFTSHEKKVTGVVLWMAGPGAFSIRDPGRHSIGGVK